jgi:general stress protein YciG
MTDPKQPKISPGRAPGEAPRSFAAGEEDGYQTDTFSRNDREGRPSEAELGGREASSADVERVLDAGEEGGYRTDTFSRNDREGLPDDDELAEDDAAAARSATPAPGDHALKAGDDPDSRDALPPSADGGGVR